MWVQLLVWIGATTAFVLARLWAGLAVDRELLMGWPQAGAAAGADGQGRRVNR